MPAFAVVAHPVDQVRAGSVTDAIAVLLAPVVAAVAVAEEHVIFAVGEEHVRAGLRLVFLDAALDQIPVRLGPVDAVARSRHADLVDRLRPAIHHFHLRPAMYHRYQRSLKRRIFGPLSTKGSSGEYDSTGPLPSLVKVCPRRG